MPRLGAGVVVLALFVGSAAAAPLDKAKAAIEASDYFTARSELDAALRAGDNQPAELAEIHKLSGIVAASLKDAKAAKEAFQKCLALSPQTTLPAGTSPRITKPFTEAQDFFKTKQPLQIKTATSNEPPAVTIEVVADPLTMIAKLEATVIVDGKPEQKLDKPVAPQVKIELPKGARIEVRVAALDANGNHLSDVGTKDVPLVIIGKVETPIVVKPKPKPTPKSEPYKERPLVLRWWLWTGAAVVFLGAGSYFGFDSAKKQDELNALAADSPNHTFDEAKDLESKARRSVLFTNIGLISGGVFAVTAGVLFLTRPKRPAERQSMSIAPVVHQQGGGVVLGGHF